MSLGWEQDPGPFALHAEQVSFYIDWHMMKDQVKRSC